jgi:integrase/recombinase XerD
MPQWGELIDGVVQPARHWIMDTSQSGPAVSGVIVTTSPVLRLAVAAYLARFKGQSRVHTESDLRGYLTWCADRELDPFTATRPHVELYLRWLQEVRRFGPSTVSRRMSVLAGFYRTCVIDGVLEHSPAESVRRPTVPAESPTLGLSHLQFEALLAASRTSANRCDFALVTMLGLLGLRIFEATGSNIEDLGEEHGHRVLRVRGKGGKVVLVPLPPAISRAIERSIAERTTGPILLTSRGTRMDRHCATRLLRRLAEDAGVKSSPVTWSRRLSGAKRTSACWYSPNRTSDSVLPVVKPRGSPSGVICRWSLDHHGC